MFIQLILLFQNSDAKLQPAFGLTKFLDLIFVNKNLKFLNVNSAGLDIKKPTPILSDLCGVKLKMNIGVKNEDLQLVNSDVYQGIFDLFTIVSCRQPC